MSKYDEWDYSDLVDFADEAESDVLAYRAQLAAANARIEKLEAQVNRVKPLRDVLEAIQNYALDNINSLSLQIMNDLADTLNSDDEAQTVQP